MRHIDVEDEVVVGKGRLQVRLEKFLDQNLQRGYKLREERVVVEVSLAYTQQAAAADEASELEGGNERGDGLTQDEVVGYGGGGVTAGGWRRI